MDKIEALLNELKTESDKENIKAIIEELGQELLLFDVVVGEQTIKPIWIEAYYKNDRFPDFDKTPHSDPCQGERGILYKHKIGRGGVDICLGCSDYKLAFLLKGTIIGGKPYKQIKTMSHISPNKSRTPYALVSSGRQKTCFCKTYRVFSGLKKNELDDYHRFEFAFFCCKDEKQKEKLGRRRTTGRSVFDSLIDSYSDGKQ